MLVAARVEAGALHRSGSGGGTLVVPFERPQVHWPQGADRTPGRRRGDVVARSRYLEVAQAGRRETGARSISHVSPAQEQCGDSSSASAGAVPRRWVSCLAVRSPRPPHRVRPHWPDRHFSLFSRSASSFLKSSRSRSGSREASVFVWEAFRPPVVFADDSSGVRWLGPDDRAVARDPASSGAACTRTSQPTPARPASQQSLTGAG